MNNDKADELTKPEDELYKPSCWKSSVHSFSILQNSSNGCEDDSIINIYDFIGDARSVAEATVGQGGLSLPYRHRSHGAPLEPLHEFLVEDASCRGD